MKIHVNTQHAKSKTCTNNRSCRPSGQGLDLSHRLPKKNLYHALYYVYMRAVNALARLNGYVGSPEHGCFTDAIRTETHILTQILLVRISDLYLFI